MLDPPPARSLARRTRFRPFVPREHGAWAMLAVPFLLGIAATAPSPWHVPLALAAISAHLLAASARAWLRRPDGAELRPSLVLYGGTFAALAIMLVVAAPPLLLLGLVAAPMGVLVAADARSGRPRTMGGSLAQVALALVLVPAAGLLSGAWDGPAVARATAVAAAYLAGTVLVVRSVIRERGNRRFAEVSVVYHAACAIAAAIALAPPYTVVFLGLTGRAAALPLVGQRAAGGDRRLRPVHVGVVELIASTAVVVVAVASPP